MGLIWMVSLSQFLPMVLHLDGPLTCGVRGDLANRRVGQKNSAKFFQIIGGKTIRPQAATTADKSVQAVCVTF